MKKGEIYWLRYDNSVGYEQSVGRPVMVLSGNERLWNTDDPGVVTVAFLSTSPKNLGVNIPVMNRNRKSWVLCNQLTSVDGRRLTELSHTVSDVEWEQVKDGLRVALDLKEPEEVTDSDDVLNLKVELDTYKKMYERVLSLLVEKRVEKDVVIPEQPKIEVDVEKLKHQMCTPTEDELNYNPVKTKLKPKSTSTFVDSLGRTRRPKGTVSVKTMDGKANINEDDWQTIVAKTGISYNTAKNIVGYRKKHGPYTGLEELLNVPRFGNGCWDKYVDMMVI